MWVCFSLVFVLVFAGGQLYAGVLFYDFICEFCLNFGVCAMLEFVFEFGLLNLFDGFIGLVLEFVC